MGRRPLWGPGPLNDPLKNLNFTEKVDILLDYFIFFNLRSNYVFRSSPGNFLQ